jgi:hypothetical protein
MTKVIALARINRGKGIIKLGVAKTRELIIFSV